jgi:hypothetical protein
MGRPKGERMDVVSNEPLWFRELSIYSGDKRR